MLQMLLLYNRLRNEIKVLLITVRLSWVDTYSGLRLIESRLLAKNNDCRACHLAIVTPTKFTVYNELTNRSENSFSSSCHSVKEGKSIVLNRLLTKGIINEN